MATGSKRRNDNDWATVHLVNRKSQIENEDWLPDMDLNHDKQIQSLLCYRYTIGQAGAGNNLEGLPAQSSGQTEEAGFGVRWNPVLLRSSD